MFHVSHTNAIPAANMESPLINLQDAIKNGNANYIEESYSGKNQNLNVPLQNGKLPLHFAILENQPEVALLLIKLGASYELKDQQQLTAIDHCVLMKNEALLSQILSAKVGQDFKEIRIQALDANLHGQILRFKQNIDQILSTPTPWSFYIEDPNNAYNLDLNGLAPIHYAILKNDVKLTASLLNDPNVVNFLTKDGISPLQLAAAKNSKEIVKLLLSKGADINYINSNGENALHYAAHHDEAKVFTTLLKKGANAYSLNRNGFTPLSFLVGHIHLRDPLRTSPVENLLFIMIPFSLWLEATVANSHHSDLDTLSWAFTLASSCLELIFLNNQVDSTAKRVAAASGFLFEDVDPSLKTAYGAWKSYHMIRLNVIGLKSIWENVRYRKLDSIKNAVIRTTNTAFSLYKLYQSVLNLQTYEYGGYQGYSGYQNDGEVPPQNQEPRECGGLNYKVVRDLKNAEPQVRILDPRLNQDHRKMCVEDALFKIDPSVETECLGTKGKQCYAKAYRDLSSRYHPDKHVGESDHDYNTILQNLNTAYELLNDHVKKSS